MFTSSASSWCTWCSSAIAFTQLWLVRERGFDAAGIARQIGAIGLAFGVLGSVVGGVLSDRLAHYIKGGHAGFMALLVLLCGPLMLAYRFAEPGSILFYTGMCAGFFLPLALYGPALALIQGLTPVQMRSTVTGFTMMVINVFAIAIGNAAGRRRQRPPCGRRLDAPVDHCADWHRHHRHRRRDLLRARRAWPARPGSTARCRCALRFTGTPAVTR